MDQKLEQKLMFSPKSVKKPFTPFQELSGWSEDLQYRTYAKTGPSPEPHRNLQSVNKTRYIKVNKKNVVNQSYSHPREDTLSPYYTHYYPVEVPHLVFKNRIVQNSFAHSLFPTQSSNIRKRYKSIFSGKKTKFNDFYYKNSLTGQRSPPVVSGLSVTFYYR